MSKDEKDQDQGFNVTDRRRFVNKEKDQAAEKGEKEEGKASTENTETGDPAPSQPEGDASADWDKGSCDEQARDLPPMTFSTLVLSLSTQAMVSLGELPDPMTNEIVPNIQLAKQAIDLLGILEQKTQGNLADEEDKFLKSSLADLRLRFVTKCKGEGAS